MHLTGAKLLPNIGILVLLVLSLVGCKRTQTPSNVGIDVFNYPPDKTLCLGGLKAKGSYKGASAETGLVLPPNLESTDFSTPEVLGTPIVLEAWCYDAEGEEIGYTKVSGAYRGGPVVSVVVVPPKRDTPLSEECREPMEVRGEQICIAASFI